MLNYQSDIAITHVTPAQLNQLNDGLIEFVERAGGDISGGFHAVDDDWHYLDVPFRTGLRLHWLDLAFHLGLFMHLLYLEARRWLFRIPRSKA